MSFDAMTTVTTSSAWLSDPRWQTMAQVDISALRSLARLIVFAAHPDDESLGVGGLLAMAGELSVSVQVVVATGNDRRRQDELEFALQELGVNARVNHLGFPDGALKHNADDLSLVISDILCQGDGPTWGVAPWPGDRHGDHRSLGVEVANAARPAAAEIFFYPVWLWQWGTPDDAPWGQMLEVPMSDRVRHRKQRALAHFTSQIQSPTNRDGVLTAAFLEHFRDGREVLIHPQQLDKQVPTGSLDAHLEKVHANSSDPWAVRTRWYERRKRAITMASLPRERFSRALEIGCSIGEVSAELTRRCDTLLALDGSLSAVRAASNRLRDSPTAAVQHMRIPHEWPSGEFDLIVISEIAYYLTDVEWRSAIRRCRESLAAGGVILLCHWLGAAQDFVQSGEQVHQTFRDETALNQVVVHRDSEFLLEVFADESSTP